MADRQPVLGPAPQDPELDRLLEATRSIKVSSEDIAEQSISFAYGNAPESSGITKQSVRDTSQSLLLTLR